MSVSPRPRPPAARRLAQTAALGAGLLGLAALGLTVFAPAGSAATLFSDNFDSGLSSGWSKSGGTWALASDGSQVLQQGKVDSELAREFNGSTGWTDYTLTARVKPLAFGAGDGYAGIAARASGSTSFYRLALTAGNQAQVQAVNSGAVTVLGSASLTVTPGAWHTLTLAVSGTTVTGTVDGTRVGSASSSLLSAGRIGLQTFHATANFDDVNVDSTGSGGGTPTPTPTTASPTPTPTGPPPPPVTGLEGYAAIGGGGHGPTTGGAAGPTVTVTSLSALETEAARSSAETIMVNGLFSGSGEVTVASDKSIIGVGSGSGLTGIGLKVKGGHNVIIRNMNISKVTASSGDGDAIHIETSDHIWIDHNNLSSDMSHDKDFYDGLIDITHAGDFVTVSWNILHDHWKLSLVGHSDSNGSEDTGHLHVTYHHNYIHDFNSRVPSLRFGTGHVYSNYLVNGDTAVHSRENAQMLVQNNVFRNVNTPIETTGDSDVDGFVNESGDDFGGGTNAITRTGSFTNPPYPFTLTPTGSVISVVTAGAGTGKI